MRTLQVAILSLLMLTACSKSDPISTTQVKLVGKWNLKSFSAKDYLGTQPRTSTGNYKPDEYIQIELGGTCYFRVDNAVTKTTWKLINDEKTIFFEPAGSLDLSEDGYEITTLTDSHLVLTAEDGTAPYKSEMKLYLEK